MSSGSASPAPTEGENTVLPFRLPTAVVVRLRQLYSEGFLPSALKPWLVTNYGYMMYKRLIADNPSRQSTLDFAIEGFRQTVAQFDARTQSGLYAHLIWSSAVGLGEALYRKWEQHRDTLLESKARYDLEKQKIQRQMQWSAIFKGGTKLAIVTGFVYWIAGQFVNMTEQFPASRDPLKLITGALLASVLVYLRDWWLVWRLGRIRVMFDQAIHSARIQLRKGKRDEYHQAWTQARQAYVDLTGEDPEMLREMAAVVEGVLDDDDDGDIVILEGDEQPTFRQEVYQIWDRSLVLITRKRSLFRI